MPNNKSDILIYRAKSGVCILEKDKHACGFDCNLDCLCLIVTDCTIEKCDFKVNNKERQAEIDGCKDRKTKIQKYCSWIALEYAVKLFDPKADAQSLFKNDSKCWQGCDFNISLSHTENAVAVALSKMPVGTDIETFEKSRFTEKLAKRILTEKEFSKYEKIDAEHKPSFLIAKWTAKESIFKQSSKKRFIAKKIETENANASTLLIRAKDNLYCTAVATKAKKTRLIKLSFEEIEKNRD